MAGQKSLTPPTDKKAKYRTLPNCMNFPLATVFMCDKHASDYALDMLTKYLYTGKNLSKLKRQFHTMDGAVVGATVVVSHPSS